MVQVTTIRQVAVGNNDDDLTFMFGELVLVLP